MNIEDIKLGNTYFYNNREIIVLSREGETDFFKVVASSSIPELNARDFCEGCLCGDHSLGLDTHEEYEEVIDTINDEINSNHLNQYIMWVKSFYIQKEPFEFKEYESLTKKITELKQDISTKKYEIRSLNERLGNLRNEISYTKSLLCRIKAETSEANDELLLTSKACAIQEKILYGINILIKNKDKKISCNSILSLIEDSIKLQQLEIGGVKNWQWYEDSIESEEKIKESAFLVLKNLLKD